MLHPCKKVELNHLFLFDSLLNVTVVLQQPPQRPGITVIFIKYTLFKTFCTKKRTKHISFKQMHCMFESLDFSVKYK